MKVVSILNAAIMLVSGLSVAFLFSQFAFPEPPEYPPLPLLTKGLLAWGPFLQISYFLVMTVSIAVCIKCQGGVGLGIALFVFIFYSTVHFVGWSMPFVENLDV